MSIGAYVLLADPAFLASSLRSYYDMVDTIAIVYDESALSWTGKPLPRTGSVRSNRGRTRS